MNSPADLEAHVEKKCLQLSIRFSNKNRHCPKCGGNLTSAVDIINFAAGPFLRYFIFCFRDPCDYWIALFERIPSGYRTTFDSQPWPPPLSDPPFPNAS
jgi:hypothetical protein